MPRKVTRYKEPSGWRHIQAAYDGITAKLDELPGNKDQRRQAIKYCQDRLKEDLDSIEAGGEPFVSPSGWETRRRSGREGRPPPGQWRKPF